MPARAASSRSRSRTASRGCATCSTISRPASTMPTRCWWRRSMRPAKTRSTASIRKRWCRCIRAGGHRDARYIEGPQADRADGARPRQTGRLRRLPRRRQHHAMGLCAAEGTRRDVGMNRSAALLARLGDSLSGLRGRMTPNAEMDKITWFRAGGARRRAVPAGRRGRSRGVPARRCPRTSRSPSSASARTFWCAKAAFRASSCGCRPRASARPK